MFIASSSFTVSAPRSSKHICSMHRNQAVTSVPMLISVSVIVKVGVCRQSSDVQDDPSVFSSPTCSLGMSAASQTQRMSASTASPSQKTSDTSSPTLHTLLLSPTTTQDMSTFLPLIERLYSSSSRLVSCSNSLTSDIRQILSAARKEESFVAILADSVSRQLGKFGCGGRTVALWSCLFFKLMKSLRELQSPICVNTVLEIAVEHCIARLPEISENVEKASLPDLCKRLSHGVEKYQLASQCCEMILSSSNSNIANLTTLSDTLTRRVTVLFEKSSSPSLVLSGHVIKTPSHVTNTCSDALRGVKKVLMVAGDISQNAGNLGYKGVVKETVVRTVREAGNDLEHRTTDESWDKRVRGILQRLGVEVVLTSGLCKIDFINTGVCCVSGISYEVLENIPENVKVDLIPSVEFATPDDVVSLEFQECKEGMTVVESPHHPTYTIVLRSPVRNGSENRYETYLSRLRNVLKSGVVIPGGGKTEMFCSEILSSFSLSADDRIKFDLGSHPDTDLLVSIISRKLSELFSRVVTLCQDSSESETFDFNGSLSDLGSYEYSLNSSLSELTLDNDPQCGLQLDDITSVYDDYSSKVGAWRLALETAKVLDSVCLSLKPCSVESR